MGGGAHGGKPHRPREDQTPHPPSSDGRSILEEAGLTKYEIDAYLTLLELGVAEAREVCQRSSVPTSKIYNAMAHLERLGLVEVQNSRPKRFMAREVRQAIKELDAHKGRELDAFRQRLPQLEAALAHRARAPRTESTFWSVAIGWRDTLEKHLSKGAEAANEYVVVLDYASIRAAEREVGQLVKPPRSAEFQARAQEMVEAIRRNIEARHVRFRLLVSAGDEDLDDVRPWVRALVGPRGARNARMTKQRVLQFHIIDGERVILLVPNPARPAEGLGSVFVTDRSLAREIKASFEEVWADAVAVEAAEK